MQFCKNYLFCYSFARLVVGALRWYRRTACGAQPNLRTGFRHGAGRRPSPSGCSLAAARGGADGAAHVQIGGLRLGLRLGFIGGLGRGHGLTCLLLALL